MLGREGTVATLFCAGYGWLSMRGVLSVGDLVTQRGSTMRGGGIVSSGLFIRAKGRWGASNHDSVGRSTHARPVQM